MATLDTRSTRLGAVLQYEDHPEYGHCRKTITFDPAADTDLVIGTVIGATGDVIAAGGTFAGIYIGSPAGENKQTVLAGVNTPVVVLFRGPAGIGKVNLVFGADVNLDAEKDAIYAQMEAAGIQVLDQPNQFPA